MSNEPETKVCPLCAETIKAAAKVCPHCRSSQKGIGVWRDQILFGAILVSWAALAGVCCMVFDPFSTGGRQFWLHQRDLVVRNATLERTLEHGVQTFSLTGYVTNRGGHAWRVQQLEVRFLNKNGAMQDVVHSQNVDCVVQPGRESPFHVQIEDPITTNSELDKIIRVSGASDPDFDKGSE